MNTQNFSLQYTVKDTKGSSSDNLSKFAIFVLFAAILYQPFLCFVNTNLFSIKSSFLIIIEGALLGLVALNFVRASISVPMLALLVLIFANTFVLAIFQQHFDPKTIRNLMIPILMIWLGTQYNHKVSLDTLLKYFAGIVIVVGFYEFFFADWYQKLFNVLNYQIATGRSTEAALKYVDTTFSLNGTRWGGRNLLPFLGNHRTSSIFLETVNMGNFGVLMACWGLAKKEFKAGLVFVVAALIVAVLADSRFASTLIVVLLALRFLLPLKLLEASAYLMPIFILLVCFYFSDTSYDDSFKGRLGSTGLYILNFDVKEFFGLSSRHYSMYVDQGYAYLLHYCGLLVPITLWICLCSMKMANDDGRIFKSLFCILISANLAISGDSVFAFKWVALAWFLIGAMRLRASGKPPSA